MSKTFSNKQLRNVGLIAHIDAGKTTTTERILRLTGRGQNPDAAREGAGTTDWRPQERERGISITAAAVYCRWRDCHINLIDTPGHVDFSAEVERSLRVLDGAVACFDGVQGVEPQSETVWRRADQHKVPRIVFVNKMDRMGADFDMSYNSILKMLGANAVPIQLPIGVDKDFAGFVDLITMKAHIWKDGAPQEREIPADLQMKALEFRRKLVGNAVEFDENLRSRFLQGDEKISPDELRKALRAGTVRCRIFPVLCGSAYKNLGVEPLLDAICDFLPSPLDLLPVQGRDALDPEKIVERRADDTEPLSALIFKVQADPFVGKVIFFRVYSGALKTGDTVMFGNNRNTERIGRLLRMHANEREEIQDICAGDIGATVALKNGRVGYTICDPNNPVILEEIVFPDPVISVALTPKTNADADKMISALQRLAEEDQTLRVKDDVEAGNTVISGMGELHLDIIVDRLKREFKVEAAVGEPEVAYRETVRKKVREEGKFIRQSGGRGQYGHCILQIEPQSLNKGFEFVNDIKHGRIPSKFVPVIEKGVREALEVGALAGFPLIDLKVTLCEGSFHETDSNDMAFKIAAAMALRSGCKKADPTLLEPIMKCEAVTPEELAGDVLGDLNSRRAKITDMGDRGHLKFIRCTVPLSEMLGYATVVRSISQGRASFTMEPSHYEEVPPNLQQEIVRKRNDLGPESGGAGRAVLPTRPKPGFSGGAMRPFPPPSDD